MNIDVPLFESDLICLAPIDHDKDPEVELIWSHDTTYMRMLSPEPVRPLAPTQVKKKYESIEKQIDDNKNLFYFTIRMRSDDRLIGFARLYWIEWSNGTGNIQIGIGEPDARGRGYGSEALQLLLHYAFMELNLHLVSLNVFEYNLRAIRSYEKAGFTVEGRAREFLNRDGRRWDMIFMGILREEWQAHTARRQEE